jgi:hypothetical protein
MENQTTAMTDNTETFTYYIGDLAYVLTDDEWDTACSQIPTRHTMQVAEDTDDLVDYEGYLDPEYFDLFNEHAGRPFIAMPTAYGDGCYLDRHGREYSVDSGTIGLINTNYITDTDKLQDALKHGLGHLLTVSTPIDASECFYDDGVLCFGAQHAECVEIDTAE